MKRQYSSAFNNRPGIWAKGIKQIIKDLYTLLWMKDNKTYHLISWQIDPEILRRNNLHKERQQSLQLIYCQSLRWLMRLYPTDLGLLHLVSLTDHSVINRIMRLISTKVLNLDPQLLHASKSSLLKLGLMKTTLLGGSCLKSLMELGAFGLVLLCSLEMETGSILLNSSLKIGLKVN